MGNVHRSEFRHRRRTDALETRAVNRVRKQKERVRRDARMVECVKSGSLPYAPAVMSWLSAKLQRPAAKITQEEVRQLVS